MAKDPAFLFYTNDFNSGTQFFSDEQVGKYMRLLMAQHQHGHLPESHMIMICKSYDKDVFSKFIKDKDGLWYNERLESEVIKRKNYSKSRSENRTSPPKEKNICQSYVPHMENENENRNGIELKLKGAFDEIYLEQQKSKWQQVDFSFELETFCDKVRGSPDHYQNHDSSGLRLAFQSQLRYAKKIPTAFNKNTTAKLTYEEL